MVLEDYYETTAFEQGELVPTSKAIPDEIARRVTEINAIQQDLIKFLIVLAKEYDLSGPDGLKARTNLIEYRYDAI